MRMLTNMTQAALVAPLDQLPDYRAFYDSGIARPLLRFCFQGIYVSPLLFTVLKILHALRLESPDIFLFLLVPFSELKILVVIVGLRFQVMHLL